MWFGCFRLALMPAHCSRFLLCCDSSQVGNGVKRGGHEIGVLFCLGKRQSHLVFLSGICLLSSLLTSQNIGELRKKLRCRLRASKDPQDLCVRLSEREMDVKKSWYRIPPWVAPVS